MFLSGFLSNYLDIEIPIEDIIQAYTSWVQEHRYMILERFKPTWDSPKSSTMFEKETIAVKSAKRGNDVYSRRVLSKFLVYESVLADLDLVSFDRGKMRTQVLFLTLTYDTRLGSRHQAWLTISKSYNLFMSKLRRVFGSISSARSFESFENGYPHIHAVLLFNDFSFEVREYIDKNGRKALLIDDDLKDCISAMWHSWVNVRGVGNVSESIRYLKKYISKCAEFDAADSKGVRTLSQCWAYRKRAYCLSGIFRSRMFDLNNTMQNSNSKTLQLTLLKEGLEENSWSCLGFVSIEVLGIEPFIWRLLLSGELRDRVYEDLGEREDKSARAELVEFDVKKGTRIMKCQECGLYHFHKREIFGGWKLLKVSKRATIE